MTALRAAAVTAGRAALVVAVAVSVLALTLVAIGWRPVVLVSGSMSPWADAGDLVVAAPAAGEDVVVGDVLTVLWRGSSAPVTHRVVDIEQGEGGAVFAITQGDANDAPDIAVTRLDGQRVLRAREVVPGGGAAFTSPWTRVVAGLGVTIVGLVGIARLWSPRLRSRRDGNRPGGRPRVVGL